MSVSDSMSLAESAIRRVLSSAGSTHAVLLYGREGAGAEQLGAKLAQGWLCSSVQNGWPCEECANCRACKNERAVDLMWIRPWGAQNLIKLSAVRKPKVPDADDPQPPLIEFFRTRPLMSKQKVALFEQADRMNNRTANALLKTLEEPPAFAKVILVTTEIGLILPTIRSRCMTIACSYDQIEPTTDMARCWGTAPAKALSIENAKKQYQQLWDLCESSLNAPTSAAMLYAERCRENAELLSKALKVTARSAQAEQLQCLANWLLYRRPDRPELVQIVADGHRFLTGNVNTGALYDHLWIKILS